jgi:valyl-tRNA synthetase
VQVGRNLRAEAGIPSNKKSEFGVKPSIPGVEKEIPTLSRLLGAETVQLGMPLGTLVGISTMGEVGVKVHHRDRDAEHERLDKEIAKIEAELRTVEEKLKNKSFVERAPKPVVEQHRQRQKDFAAQLKKVKQTRDGLN